MINIPNVNFRTVSDDGKVGVFEFEPLIKGFGSSLGSSLRRTLYSATRGSVITKVSIDGVRHQFTTIEGAKDDVLQILLNLKKVRIKKVGDEPVELELDMKGPGNVTASDIIVPDGVEIMNKDLVITSLSDAKSKLKVKMVAESGFGYVEVEESASPVIGEILLDASFSPINNVIMKVSPTRVGKDVNYDKLDLTVETDGSIKPEEAVRNAAVVLKKFFYRIETGEDYKAEEDAKMAAVVAENQEAAMEANAKVAPINGKVAADEIVLEELRFPTRTINALKKAGIKTLGDLAAKSEDDLLKIRNLGEKSIREILALLEEEGLKK